MNFLKATAGLAQEEGSSWYIF